MSTDNFLVYKAIENLKARYCRFMDTKQWEKWGELFSAAVVMDVSDDVPPEVGEAITKGRDTVVAQVRSFVGPAQTVHQVHSPEIELTSATTAKGVWAMSDVVIWPDAVTPPVPGVNALKGFGHYHEQYQLIDGEWKICALKLTRLLIETE